jgi:hypothetical protein
MWAIEESEFYICPTCGFKLEFSPSRGTADNIFFLMINSRCTECFRKWIAENFSKMEKKGNNENAD